jgi:flavorubredoxin
MPAPRPAAVPTAKGAVELIPGRLYALGGTIPLDGTVSWVPASATGFQPAHCYLALDEEAAILIDTGLRYHQDAVLAQLRALLPDGLPLSIFLTRSEFDCTGNFAAIVSSFEVDSLFTGGGQNPFDAFSDTTALPDTWRNRVMLARTPVGQPIPLDESGRWLVLAPAIRTLATFWAYDRRTATLFTSDLFGHTTLHDHGASPVIDDPADDDVSYDQVRDHLLSKFFWLSWAQTRKLSQDLRTVFEERQVEIVAPSHGCVLMGSAVVQRHHELIQRCLKEVGKS